MSRRSSAILALGIIPAEAKVGSECETACTMCDANARVEPVVNDK